VPGANEVDESDKEAEGDDGVVDDESQDDADAAEDDEDVVAAWLSALGNAEADDGPDEEEEDISREEIDNTSDDDESDEDPLETQDPNMQPLPEENERRYPQENDKYFLNKCYVRKDKFPLELFMNLANITSSNTEEDHGISFPELYEIFN
jgi:hypothetical protein